MNRLNLIASGLLVIAGCTADATVSISKDDARELTKADWPVDFCERLGWYGDGICDDFCPMPDPDCVPVDRICGGFLGTECAEGEYCHFDLEAGCGFADASGICKTIPNVCTREFMPVCGCNGQTYSNKCQANAAGTSVKSEGPCAPTTCEVGDDSTCPEGLTCVPGICPLHCTVDDTDCCLPATCVPPPEPSRCVVGGCSGQLCYDSAMGDLVSTCEWRDEYACYDSASCERQPDGNCGWTQTPELLECIDNAQHPDDCRMTGCGEGEYCTYCWVNFACIPEGALC